MKFKVKTKTSWKIHNGILQMLWINPNFLQVKRLHYLFLGSFAHFLLIIMLDEV